jgi:hypothetical protein
LLYVPETLDKDNPAAQCDGKTTGTFETGKGKYTAITTRRGAALVIDGCRAPVLFLSSLTVGVGVLLK